MKLAADDHCPAFLTCSTLNDLKKARVEAYLRTWCAFGLARGSAVEISRTRWEASSEDFRAFRDRGLIQRAFPVYAEVAVQ